MAARKPQSRKRPARRKSAPKALRAEKAHVRRASPRGDPRAASDAVNAGTARFAPLIPLAAAYGDWSGELMRCKTPFDVWQLQMRFGMRFLGAWQAATLDTFRPSPVAVSIK